jgi:hypothetical protein
MHRPRGRNPSSMPVMVSLTQLEPLDPHSDSIRLIELLPGNASDAVACNVIYVSLSEAPDYAAVSYTWSDKFSKCSSLIWVDGRPCRVRPMLKTMLMTLRDPSKTMKLWIDAVCIDQKNLREKRHQV